MTSRQAQVFLLVGIAMLFAGYDMNVFGLAAPQIQASLGIPEDKLALTLSFIRIATIFAVMLAWAADLVGRRRLLLITIVGQALATLATGFVQDYNAFVACQILTRVFGYAEEMLCYVVIAEEVAASQRGWSSGTLGALYYMGGGIASLVFAFVTVLPYGWRSLYVIGAVPLFMMAYMRRRLPETQRFEVREKEVEKMRSRLAAALEQTRLISREYPGRLTAMLIAAAAFGFAIWPAEFLWPKYLQSNFGFKPYETTLLIIPGGLLAVAFNILSGRLSDHIGRRITAILGCLMAMIGFAFFYSGLNIPYLPLTWIVAFAGFLLADALIAGLSAELFPTSYRATVSGLRYLTAILAGAISLALEGPLYNVFHTHGIAVLVLMGTMPIAMIALLTLPEPAGRSLEEISGEARHA
ncbi:putative MFS transporter [Rhizomicrobium palustre]|uniref:Putative MFS transporter n=2 Tax=Rhizomicrobium palustre TaxID=189966 RepID=A0A846N4F6_9PROT|nr:MFS transporter [Rhizomicrobium palustre]NIK90355.1 putative MFS transporter [Rhizomicrobium palustre]